MLHGPRPSDWFSVKHPISSKLRWASVKESISAYYSALSDEDVIEQVEWGEFATREFPSEP